MDLNDPAAVLADVAGRHPRCFWLDGGGAREWSGRRSLVGWLEPSDVSLSYDAAAREVRRHVDGTTTVVGDDVFAVLEAELSAGAADDQWFGYLGYACRPDLPARPSTDLPDAVWMRPSHLRLFDHPAVAPAAPEASPDPPAGVPDDYRRAFERVQEHLHAGNSYEVNLTHRHDVPGGPGSVVPDPVTAYLRLRALNPAPYAGFLQHDVPGARGWLLSSSPERYAAIGADRTITTKPVKGTTPREADPAADADQRRRLASDPRYRAENLMIVDLLRNDLSMVCEPGTVEVPVLMDVESYAGVHQLVSTVRGRLRDDVSSVAALRALFPAGSMTGAPKQRTMEIIEEVEATPRGAYAGAFGWIAADGRADVGVVIRTLTTTGSSTGSSTGSAGSTGWRLGTGGGITVLSDVESEHAEAALKADRLLRVFAPDPR